MTRHPCPPKEVFVTYFDHDIEYRSPCVHSTREDAEAFIAYWGPSIMHRYILADETEKVKR